MPYQDFLKLRDRVAFNQGPYTASPTWTDITTPSGDNSLAARSNGNFATGRQSRNGAAEATSVTLTCGNRDGRYTPWNSGSAYYPLTEAAPYQRHCEYPLGSGTWYPLWGGVMSDCNATFDAGVANASMTFQQRLGLVSNRPLKAIAVGQILKTNPQHFWPLDDDAGSDSGRDARGADHPTFGFAYQGTNEGEADAGQYEFGVGFAPGEDGGTRLALTPRAHTATPGLPVYGYYGTAVFPAVPTAEAQAAVVVSLTSSGETTTGRMTPLTLVDDVNGDILSVQHRADLIQLVRMDPTGGGLENLVQISEQFDDGYDHALGVSVTVSGTTATAELFIDGVSKGSGAYDVSTGDIRWNKFQTSSLRYSDLMSGTLANVTIWGDVDNTRHTYFAESANAFADDTADIRFVRLTELAGYSTEWVGTVGTFERQIGSQLVAGREFLDLVKELEAAEVGRLMCDHDGRLILASNNAFHTPARSVTVSALRHFDLDGDFGTDNDNLVNEWSGTRAGGPVQIYEAAPGLIEESGQQSKDSGTLPLTTDDDVLSVGHWEVNSKARPALRVPLVKLRVPSLHNDGLLTDVLELSEGDQMVLEDLPLASPVTEYVGLVERIEKQITGNEFNIVVTLSSWIEHTEFDDDALGRFSADSGSITLDADITASATTLVAVTAPGSPPFTDAPGDLPFDISVRGERMTVTAVSGPASPQTLTVTRGIAPTRPHARTAGAPIDIWHPGVLGI